LILLLIRHASAGDSAAWTGDDRARPLDEVGPAQSAALVDVLADRPLTRILTSPYLRCVQTAEPLARARGLPLEYRHELGDDARPEEAMALMRELTEEAALCVHGDLIQELLGEELKKGAVAAVEVTEDGLAVRERFGPF
jgi:phosphohistidine phosphatase SixA